MEGSPSTKQTPPASSLDKSAPAGTKTIGEKLSMTSPNNIPETQIITISRPRSGSRSGRRRSSLFRKSFDSIQLGDSLSSQLTKSDSNHTNGEKSVEEMLGIKSPKNGNRSGRRKSSTFTRPKSFDSIDIMHSLSPRGSKKKDRSASADKMSAMPSHDDGNRGFNRSESTRIRAARARRASLDCRVFALPFSSQGGTGGETLKTDRSPMEEKLCMTSPNNSTPINRIETQILTASPRQRSRFARPGRRRNSVSSVEYSVPLSSLPAAKTDNSNNNNKNNSNSVSSELNAPVSSTSGHRAMPILSSSGHTIHSCFTEITINSDTLLSNKEESDGSDSSSCYYSDGGIPYDPSMRYSIQISDDIEDEDDSDDSSNSNFNYEARDNGSYQTLESAFTLNDLGSNDTVSSLSILGDESDTNVSDDEALKRIQLVFAPLPSKQFQRQQRRTSYASIGRRRRRFSKENLLKSGDNDNSEVPTDGDEDEETLDGVVPDIPNLRNQTYSGSGTEEEIIEEVETDGEYFEELLNDISENNDTSSKRYEIIVSDDSFEEEVVIELSEEEITVEDDECEGSGHDQMMHKINIDDDNNSQNPNDNDCLPSNGNEFEFNDDNETGDHQKTPNNVEHSRAPPKIDDKSEHSTDSQREDLKLLQKNHPILGNGDKTDHLSTDASLERSSDCPGIKKDFVHPKLTRRLSYKDILTGNQEKAP